MRSRIVAVALAVGALSLFGLPPFFGGDREVPHGEHPYSRVVSAEALYDVYLRWQDGFEANGGIGNLVIRLGEAPGHSAEPSKARGVATFDLYAGRVDVAVAGLEAGDWEAWLVDNQPGDGHSTLPEPGDRFRRLGELDNDAGYASLRASFGEDVGYDFAIDRVVLTRAGDRPEERPVLLGAATLFERVYMQVTDRPSELAPLLASVAPAGPGPATAFAVDSPFNSLDPLVAQGADLFFNETFDGNGRTCATCHPAENNFTIDTRFVAGLPANDPLFVPDFVPALADLDNTTLIRELGLISVPIDGFENPSVQRAVPHLLGLSRYLEPGNQAVPPLDRTGWSGDGAPGSGTIREFALGAVTAHFPLTLARTPGVDFRVPTDQELDALEAFLLVLGRQDFPDISEITLLDPVSDAGRELFQIFAVDEPLCTFCHLEAGANGPNPGENGNFDIGVETMTEIFHPATVIQPGSLPPDGGFGTDPLFDPVTNEFLGFGTFNAEEDVNERRFNSFPAIESVDTAPFFHNHAVATIEEAVDFYTSDEFLGAPSALPIKMTTSESEAIAAFLRVMNTLENIRASNLLAEAAIDESDDSVSRFLADLASFDTEDGYQVLEERYLHPDAVAKLKLAFFKEKLASKLNADGFRNALLHGAIDLKLEAKDLLVVE